MRVTIADTNYSDQKYRGLAATWLQWECSKKGVDIVNPSDRPDFILMTTSSQQGVGQIKSWLRKWKPRCPVILGGVVAWAPAIFNDLVDVICVGEGQRFIRILLSHDLDAARALPEAWIPGETRSVIPGDTFPWDCPPLRHPDGTVRVWGSRGCKRACLFCQTGWERSYAPSPAPHLIKAQIAALKRQGEKVAIITNDAASEELIGALGQQEFVSVTLANIRALQLSRNITKSIRIGVEGVSERLRRGIGKPITNEQLCDITIRAWEARVGVRWFFIAGLPGENDGDWEELRGLVDVLRTRERGCVMANFHAFIPQPATPLGVLPLQDTYWERFEEFRRWFFHGIGFTRRLQIVPPAQYGGRMKRARESMAASEAELRRGWFWDDNDNWRIKYKLSPEQLRKIATIYARRIDMSLEVRQVTP